MRVLLSALALTALLLLVGAASVFAADGVLPTDVTVTLDPVEPPAPPTTDPAAPTVETVTEIAAPATEPVVDAAAPLVGAIVDAGAPVAAPVVDAAAPILDPVVDIVAPVAGPVLDVVAPVADVGDPVLAPVVDVVDPLIQPVLDVGDPVVGPIVDLVDPIVDPGIDPIPPITDPIPPIAGPTGGGDHASGPSRVPAPAFDPNSLLSDGVAWFDGDSSVGFQLESSRGHGSVAAAAATPAAETGASSPGSPGGLPWRGAPFGLPAGSAGPGGALSLGAWIALLAAGMLAIVFHAFRRPWSSLPTLRGRSLLPALRPA